MRLLLFLVWSSLNCFNPRIRKGCDKANALAARAIAVSIHASVKDATDVIINPITQTVVSIHASVKDATFGIPVTGQAQIVSIHASVKDAT